MLEKQWAHVMATSSAEALPLALTCGEPAGIGPEISAAAWLRAQELDLPPFFLIAAPDVLDNRGVTAPVQEIASPAEAHAVFQHALPLLGISTRIPVTPGKPSTHTAGLVISSIETAVKLVLAGEAAGVVTNPIQKAVLTNAGFAFPGHTEFLAHLTSGGCEPLHPVMMLANDKLRAVPLTIHIPLSAVPGAVTADLLKRTCRVLDVDLKARFGIAKPHIAVAGLNPHAGEDGLIGTEDRDVLVPAIEDLAKAGLSVTGPYPADAMFRDTSRDDFDVAVCMYHDQALLPVKTLGFHDSVNVTLGLPIIRTSPDHGTALDLAGTDQAKPDSLIAALKMAAQMAAHERGG